MEDRLVDEADVGHVLGMHNIILFVHKNELELSRNDQQQLPSQLVGATYTELLAVGYGGDRTVGFGEVNHFEHGPLVAVRGVPLVQCLRIPRHIDSAFVS